MKLVAVAVFLVACGGVAVDPDAGPDSDAAVDAATDAIDDGPARGHVCMTDPNNGAGFYVDGGCDIGGSCVADDGLVGKCY